MLSLSCSECVCMAIEMFYVQMQRSSRRRCYIDFERRLISFSSALEYRIFYSHSLKLRNVSHVIRFTCIAIHFSHKTHPTPKKKNIWPTSVLIIDDHHRHTSQCCCHQIFTQSLFLSNFYHKTQILFISPVRQVIKKFF